MTHHSALCPVLAAVLLVVAAAEVQKRQTYYQRPSAQDYYKRPSQPQQSYYQPGALAPRPAYQPVAPAPRPAYYQPVAPAPRPAYYQPVAPAPRPAYYQPAPQAGVYSPQVPPPAPAYYQKPKKEKGQDLSKVPGTAGVDYPIYHSVPDTKFSCNSVPTAPGIYANVETGCQAYHVCHDGREGHQGASFLCPNGTLFNQQEFSCDWWYNVNCADAPQLYSLNSDPLKNPYSPKPKKEDEIGLAPGANYYPA